MTDNKKIVGPQDSSRVNVHEDYEVRYWTHKWNVSEQQLREAVAAVGPSVEAVRRHLGK